MIIYWKFRFHDIGITSPPADLLYSNVAGISGYTRKILNFDGVTSLCDLTSGAIPTASASFEIEDAERTMTADDLVDEYVTINQTDSGTLDRSWKLKIKSAVYSYGTHKVKCESELSGISSSKFPPYASIKSLFPQKEEIPDNLCVPYTIGKAYIPIYPILARGVRRYLLGKTDDVTGDFTIIQVRSPRNYTSVSYWDDSYTYNQTYIISYSTRYQITDMIIARSVPRGEVDSNGVFQVSGKILSPLVEYEGDEESKHPGAFTLDVLEKAGVTNCDDDSFTDVDTANFTSVNWAGGFYVYQDQEALISGLLSQCDCYLTQDDETHLNIFDSESVETFDKSMIVEGSYSISAIRKPEFDGGIVKWRWYGEPQDVLSAEYAVQLASTNSSIIPLNPDTEAFEYPYGVDTDSTNALKFGILHFQKKHTKKAQVSFSTKLDKISTKNTLFPAQVIDIDDDTGSSGIVEAYESLKILIYELHFKVDGTVGISGYAYEDLDDFGSISTNPVYPEGETSTDIIISDSEENAGDADTLNCVNTELLSVYSLTPTNSGFYTSKTSAEIAAFNLWNSFGDSAKWEPWDGAAVTTNHTWTGDTGSFAITSGALTITLIAGESKSINLASLAIHAEDLRINSTITITGTSENTYCRIKLTDSDSTVRYLYLGVGDSAWEDDEDEFLIGSGTISETLSDYGLSETITDISIQCGVSGGDTSIVVSIGYIDFEYCHDLYEDCAACYGDSPEVESGAYVVLTDTVAYTFYFDECESGDAAYSTNSVGQYYSITTLVDEVGSFVYEDSEERYEDIEADYELAPWETVQVDLSENPMGFLLPQESDYTLKIGDQVRIIDVFRNASSNSLYAVFTDSPCEEQIWGSVEMDDDGGLLEFTWAGSEIGWHQIQYPRYDVNGNVPSSWEEYFDNTYWYADSGFNWDGAEWDSTDTTGWINYASEGGAGPWRTDYRPEQVRVTFSGGASGGTLSIELIDTNYDTIASQSNPTSPQEIDITFGDYDIERLKFTNFSGSITNIEFY